MRHLFSTVIVAMVALCVRVDGADDGTHAGAYSAQDCERECGSFCCSPMYSGVFNSNGTDSIHTAQPCPVVVCVDGEFLCSCNTTTIECQAETVCTYSQFESDPPTRDTDRVCQTYSACASDQVEFSRPTETSDRGCVSVTMIVTIIVSVCVFSCSGAVIVAGCCMSCARDKSAHHVYKNARDSSQEIPLCSQHAAGRVVTSPDIVV